MDLPPDPAVPVPWWRALRPTPRMWGLLCLLATPVLVIEAGGGSVDPRWLRAQEGPPPAQPSPDLARLLDEVKRFPDSVPAALRLAAEYLRQDRLREATDMYYRAVPHTEALRGLSRIAVRMDDPPHALALARRAEERQPQDPEVLNQLAVVLILNHYVREAGETFDRALALRPRDPWILLNAATCRAGMEKWGEAEAYCRRAVEAAPDAVEPRLLMSYLYSRQGRAAEADAEIERLAREHPDSAVAQEALGRVRMTAGRPQDSLEAMLKSQRLLPDWPAPYVDAGYALLQMQDYGRAVEHFEKALQLSSYAPPALHGIAEAYGRRGWEDRAMEVYERLLRENPEDPTALNNLAYLCADRGVDIERALRLARRAVSAGPGNGSFRDTLGWACHRAGRNAEAVSHFQEARRLSPDNALIPYHLGKALRAAGRDREAAQAFQDALSGSLPADARADAEASAAALRR